MEIDRICFLKPELLYSKYFYDRKKLLIHISDVMGKGNNWKRSISEKTRKNRKIAMLVMGLHSKRFASTRLQVGLANELGRRGWQVTIFVADTNYANRDDLFIIMPKTIRRNFSKTCFQKDHWEMIDEYVNVQYFTHDNNDQKRYKSYMDALYQYNPEVVIDITNEQCVYNPQLIKDFPIITIPLNGYSSSCVCDAYIARNQKLMNLENKTYHSITCEDVYEANLYLPYDVDHIKYVREEKGFLKSDFIAITVGNRLDYEITDNVKKDMKSILEKNCRLKWIIVGPVETDHYIILEKQIKHGQVVLWGYENNLQALYKMCDVYLNIPRSGGGGSVALAVQCGIPAIIEKHPISDILPFLGEEMCAENWDDAVNMLLKMMESRIYRKRTLVKQSRNLNSSTWSVEHFGDVLEKAINKVTLKRYDAKEDTNDE